jgi:glycyl-tRNA synthetase beta chain
MPDLLLELGCEELPATFVQRAMNELQTGIEDRLRAANLKFERVHEPIGTPRRLIVHLAAVDERQEDQTKEQRGPALKAAYDSEGNPTPALLGFCRSQGVDPADLRKEGDYVWITKTIPGKPTAELLTEILPHAIKGLTFDKAMRWGTSRIRFARPIRWILASFGGNAVEFQIESVTSALKSRGHRFNFPEEFEARTREELLEGLRQRDVEPDQAVRRERIVDGAKKVAGGEPELKPDLIEENIFLTEWPHALEGQFKPEYLDLPEPVLVTAMAKHERFFPVRGSDGRLTNRFVSIRNGGVEEVVREGNEWVLNARFNDAKFFFDEDRKLTLIDFWTKTQGIIFQERLGTVNDRAERLAKLAFEVARHTGASHEEAEFAANAGLYSKADLSTGLVSELPALQGLIGEEYARRDGLPEPVARAIGAHYDLQIHRGGEGVDATALRLHVADQLDKLAGYLGIGLVPSGSSDPYGLRRSVSQLINATQAEGARIRSYLPLFRHSMSLYESSGMDLDTAGATSALVEIFISRYEALIAARHDILEAALLPENLTEVLDPRGVRMRIAALNLLAEDRAFVHTATRPLNIVSGADKKGLGFSKSDPLTTLDLAALDSAEGEALAAVMREHEQTLFEARLREDAEAVAEHLKRLAEPINAFFDSTMVMVDDERARHARLTLLNAACEQLRVAGDFTKIVIEDRPQ